MKLLHLFPNLMNLYGDYGNIVVLKKHLQDQGFDIEVVESDDCVGLDLQSYDFIYMGSATEHKQMLALDRLSAIKDDIKAYINSNKSLLFTGNAMELLGKQIDDKEALGILDFNVQLTSKRYTGDVIVKNDDMGEVVGFINKSSMINATDDYKLFDYVFKDNNLIDNDFEGYRINNAFGSHIIGPVLVKNPNFMKIIVKTIMQDKKAYKDISYPLEEEAYQITLKELKLRK